MKEEQIDFFKNFRRNFELLRTEKGLSKEELSIKLNMKPNRITDIEYGKHGRGVPKSFELFQIASFFGITVEIMVHAKAKVIFNE